MDGRLQETGCNLGSKEVGIPERWQGPTVWMDVPYGQPKLLIGKTNRGGKQGQLNRSELRRTNIQSNCYDQLDQYFKWDITCVIDQVAVKGVQTWAHHHVWGVVQS